MWIALIISILVGLIYLGWWIASIQNRTIDVCLGRMKKHNSILVGDLKVKDISNSDLVKLNRPLYTHVGMGGIGPCYNPSFTVYSLISDELSRRRGLT